MHKAQLEAAGKLVPKGPDFEENDNLQAEEMTDEEKAAAAKAAADAKAAKDKENELSAEDKLQAKVDAMEAEMAEMKGNYEAVLKDNEDQKDREKAHTEKEKAKLVKQLPDGYPNDVSLGVMRKDLIMHQAQLKAAGKLVAEGPDFVEKDDLLGDEMTEEMYQKAAKAEDEVMGISKGFAAGMGSMSKSQYDQFQYTQQTGTQYRAPSEPEPKK